MIQSPLWWLGGYFLTATLLLLAKRALGAWALSGPIAPNICYSRFCGADRKMKWAQVGNSDWIGQRITVWFVRYPTQLWFIVTGEPKLAATDQAPQRLVRYGSCAVVSACTNTVQSIVQQQELWYCMHCTAPGHQPKRFWRLQVSPEGWNIEG